MRVCTCFKGVVSVKALITLYIRFMKVKVASKYLVYALVVVLFIIGSIALLKAHPEVQFAFYIPATALIIYAVIYDDLFAKPHHLSALRELRAIKTRR